MHGITPELFDLFGFWGTVMMLKMMLMLPLTARQRFRKMIFANQEDTAVIGGGKVLFNDPDVERVRRAHLNDIENILPWIVITYLWLTTGPSVWVAKIAMQTFSIARITHTLSYAVYSQQPTRAISFFVAFVVMAYEAISTLLYYS